MQDLGKAGLVAKLHEHREIENARNGRVVHREDSAMRGGGGKLLCQPVELGAGDLAVVMTRDCRVEGDDPKSADPVHPVDGSSGRMLTEQGGAERPAVVMVAHHPDDLCTISERGRLDDRLQFFVGDRVAGIREVTGDDDRLGTRPGDIEFGEQLAQVGLAVDGSAIEPSAPGDEMGITQVNDKVVGPWILGRVTGHAPIPSPQAGRLVNKLRRSLPQIGADPCTEFGRDTLS